MELLAIASFLVIVFLGSYVQSVAGFAMGMIIVALLGGLRIFDVPTTAAIASLLTILNVFLALRGQWRLVHKHIFLWLGLGQVPAIFIGFELMHWLDSNTRWILELCLGVFVTIGGLSMTIRPEPRQRVSGRLATWLAGASGGLIGGMFSASGPVLGWFGYSQPLKVAEIRATLLACFVLTTTTRTAFVAADGGLTEEVLTYTLVGLPVVVVGTWAGRRFAPPLEDLMMKRLAFGLLMVMGLWILASAIYLR